MPQIVPGTLPVSGVPPMMAAQYGYAQLLHGQGSRKNATRESTQQLKVWLKEHQKNPYPTKGEKIMLALMSGKQKFSLLKQIRLKNLFFASKFE